MNKYKIDISAIEGMEIIHDNKRISSEFFQFYSISRRYRDRLAHRYKMPSDFELIKNLKDNISLIDELKKAIENLINYES